MKGKVVGLRGERIPEPSEVNPHVVAHLENMLEQAKAGRIQCIAGVHDTPDGVWYFNMGNALGFDVIGGLEVVKARIIRIIQETEE